MQGPRPEEVRAVGQALTKKGYGKAQGGWLMPWANPDQERVWQIQKQRC